MIDAGVFCPECGRPIEHYGEDAGVEEYAPVECGHCPWQGPQDALEPRSPAGRG